MKIHVVLQQFGGADTEKFKIPRHELNCYIFIGFAVIFHMLFSENSVLTLIVCLFLHVQKN
jgi:hypothetical protein